MEIIVYVAEVRNYGPSDRIGSAIEPWKTLFSFEPIPKSERIVTYREAGENWERVIRTTGGELPGYTLKALVGEWSNWEGPKCFKLPRSTWLRAKDLLARARSGSGDVWIVPPKRAARGILTVDLGPPPTGSLESTRQAAFAW